MSHPHTTSAHGASAPAVAPEETTDVERPLAASIERPATDPLQQARELIAAGELNAASTTLRALIAREPRNVRARGELAALLEGRRDAEGALAELGRALDIAPDDVPLLCSRAALLTAKGRYDAAEADLRRAVRAGEDGADVQLQLGVLFCKRARWREAIEPLRAAVAAEPRNPAAHYYLGDAYNSTDDLEAALASYRTAAALDPSHHRALKAIGVVLDGLRRPAEAEAAYQRAREAQRR